jgi:hypothetical protein
MRGKKVYVLQIEQVVDYVILQNDCDLYEHLDDAKQALKSFVDDEMQYVKRDGWEIDSNDDMSFCAYLEGEYPINHVEAVIKEEIIQ